MLLFYTESHFLIISSPSPPPPQSLAKITVNFQSGEVAPGEDPCTLLQYCDTGSQTDIMGEVGGGGGGGGGGGRGGGGGGRALCIRCEQSPFSPF